MAGLAPGANGARRLLLVAVACLAARPSWATRQVLRGAQDPATGSALGDVFERVRFAAVRIEAIQASVDFFRPYRPGDDWASTGSGFAVSFNGLREAAKVGSAADLRIENAISFGAEVPTFVTNAHVVRNAHRVNVQMPAIGQEKFRAYVPVICEDFDIALVRLQEPEKFQKALLMLNASVRPFDIHVNNSGLVHMGLGVVSVGFPLGSSTLKIGTGIISGTEQTGTRTRTIVCYQSTAPISPGSSGGPLLARDSSGDYQVIGVTYASAASSRAQNTNYVLPSIHIFPVLHELVQRSVPGSGSGPQMHVQLRFAPSAATLIESSEGIYTSSGGCAASGAFISKISWRSVLAFAEPPVHAQSLLVAVDDIQLDKFGMGRAPGFTGHPIPFWSILTARADLNKSQAVTICQNGKQSIHNVSMWWRPEYDLGVREVMEPYYEKELLDYEVFGGVTMMRMTLNHVNTLLNECTQWGTCTMGRWLMERNQIRPRVIVSHVEQGSYAYSVLAEGMTINKVNGHYVATLEDVRNHFVPEGPAWSLETDRSIMLKVKFEETLAAQLFSAYSAPSKRYLLTPAVKEALAGSPVLQAAVGVSSHGNSTGPPDVSTAAWAAAARANSSSGASPAVEAEDFAKDGQISYTEAKELWLEAEDGKAITDVERGTLEYILKEFKCTEKAATYMKAMLSAGKVKSYYKQIDGVKYDRELLEKAEKFASSGGRVSVAEANNLWEDAQDGKGVTPTEKATLEYTLKISKYTDKAASFMKEVLSLGKTPTYYKQIGGVKYDRELLEKVEAATKSAGVVSLAEAEAIWDAAQDGKGVTEVEKATLEYSLKHFKYTDEAAEFMQEKFA